MSPEEELNIIYDFLLELYMNKVFKEYGGEVKKKLIQDSFNSFCSRKSLKCDKKIIEMLVNRDFAHPNHHGKLNLKIKTWSFMQLHTKRIKERDDKLIKDTFSINQNQNVEENPEKIKKEKFIFDFLVLLNSSGKLIEKRGFFYLEKMEADQFFKDYCLTNGFHNSKLVTMLRNHGYLQDVNTSKIVIRANKFLENIENFKNDKVFGKHIPKQRKESTKEIEINENFQKTELDQCNSFSSEDLKLNDLKKDCFICQESFSNKRDLENHCRRHRNLEIYHDNNHTIDLGNFKVFQTISKFSRDFLFILSSIVENVLLKRIIFAINKFHYPLENIKLEKSKEIMFTMNTKLFEPGHVYPLMISYTRENDNKIYFIQYLFEVKRFYYNKSSEDNEYILTSLIPEEDLNRTKLITPVFNKEKELRLIFKKYRDFYEFKNQLRNFSDKMDLYLRLNYSLNRENFVSIYKILLKIEELSIEEEYEKLSKNDSIVQVKFDPTDPEKKTDSYDPDRFSITLKNLSKNTALDVLLKSHDVIILSDTRSSDEFRCFITEVLGNKVFFHHNNPLNKLKFKQLDLKKRYRVEFQHNKLQFEYQYRALDLVKENLANYLFPSENEPNGNKKSRLLSSEFLFQKNLSSEQIKAVSNITGKSWSNKSPYLIFGPPGTGKTMTIVESVLQILKSDTSNKILISVNSNAACDEIGKRLKKFIHLIDNSNSIILRIYSAAYVADITNWEDDFLKISNLNHGYHFYPTLETVQSFRVVIATCMVSAKYVQSGLKKGNFSHIFIDENASITLPESLLVLADIWTPKTKLILSGDPLQLGAVLRSSNAERLGLGNSLMGILMENTLYIDRLGKYNPLIQTRLTINYRSHSEILKLFNEIFYESKLDSSKQLDQNVHMAENWHLLIREKIPIIFVNNYKPSERNEYETSWYNFSEVRKIFEYIRELLFFGFKDKRVREEDIGIISPYKKQCAIIRYELDRRGWKSVLVGCPEIFQGQEKPIIIASIVRSETFSVGFLSNFRRLNVIISRAQSLLIIICNDNTLSADRYWKKLIDMCKQKGVFVNPVRNGNNFVQNFNYSKRYID